MTTHFLDEAEYLGDRIGIMSNGHFLCSGTRSFLKLNYPCGFNINLLINSIIFNDDYKQQFYDGLLHIQRIECYKKFKKCEESVDKTLGYGHIQKNVKCCEEPKICEELVNRKLLCGHMQRIKCCEKPKNL